MNKSNNNLQQKLQSPSGPHAAVCNKLKKDIKRWDFWKPTKNAEYQAEGSPNYR